MGNCLTIPEGGRALRKSDGDICVYIPKNEQQESGCLITSAGCITPVGAWGIIQAQRFKVEMKNLKSVLMFSWGAL